jgi:AraC-like DNA-binding protein
VAERIPQGILHAPSARERFELTRHQPAAPLRPFLHYYWIARWDLRGLPPHEQRVLPNLSVHVTFNRKASGVFGPAHRTFSHLLEGRDQVLGARFRPGCFRPFLGRPVHTLADTSAPLTEAFGPGAERAAEAIRQAGTTAEMCRIADELLCANLPRRTSAQRDADLVMTRLAADSHITRVEQLAAVAGISVRSLQRLFNEQVGVSPKWAIRVYRLNDAAARIGDTAPGDPIDHAALAAALGYSDQSHFIRDFAAVVGTTPGEYQRSEREQGRRD